MCDYLAHEEETKSFYHRFPSIENFEAQISEKGNSFSMDSRTVLVQQLEQQYAGLDASEATTKNIQSLGKATTFTITTGHQLNLFTGPLYFLYKIVSVINLSEALNKKHPTNHFVPIYWMATEDHDFDEINYFNLHGKKVTWDRESGGAVGELSTDGLKEVLSVFKSKIGNSVHGQKLQNLFEKAYVEHDNLASATRFLGNELFKDFGLVIIDGNDKELKKAFIPFAEMELIQNRSFEAVTRTTQRLIETGYGEQVHPREINLFYLDRGIRERIIEREGRFFVNDTDLVFSKSEILEELQQYPERFSPNALLRPLYQEVILPNLCYTGGGGELAYWFQLKDYFEGVDIPFPILLLRNSVLLVPEKLSEKLQKLDVHVLRLFQKQHVLEEDFTKQITDVTIDFTEQRAHLKKQFANMYELAKKTDASFLGAVGAQEHKQLKGLDHLEKRLLKAQKRKLSDQLERLTEIQNRLFPNMSLQERSLNFSEFYVAYGDRLFNEIKNELNPLGHHFSVLNL